MRRPALPYMKTTVSINILNLLWQVILLEVYEENTASHSNVIGKLESSHFRCGNYLKINCNTESESLSMNFLHSVTLKSISLSCFLNESFTQAWFCNIGDLKNSGSRSYADLPNVDTFHYMYKKATFINTTTDLIRKDILQWIQYCLYGSK